MAWSPCCSSPACNSGTLALASSPETSQPVWPGPPVLDRLPVHRPLFASAGCPSLCRSSWERRSAPRAVLTRRGPISLPARTCCDHQRRHKQRALHLDLIARLLARVCVLSVHSRPNVLNWAQEGRLMSDCCQTEKKPSAIMSSQSFGRDLVFPKNTYWFYTVTRGERYSKTRWMIKQPVFSSGSVDDATWRTADTEWQVWKRGRWTRDRTEQGCAWYFISQRCPHHLMLALENLGELSKKKQNYIWNGIFCAYRCAF